MIFSSEELYVLASLLGREYLIGVEDKTLENSRSDLKGMFKRNYDDLEARGLFEYRIDGTLLVDREVKNSIKVLNKAETVYVIATDIRGKKEKVTFLQYRNSFCKIADNGRTYSSESTDTFDEKTIMDSFNIKYSNEPISVCSIPLNSLKEICELYSSFNETEAEELLSESVLDTDAKELIHRCLISKNYSFVMKGYRKNGNHLVNVNNLFLRFCNEYILSFSIKNNDNVIVNIYRKENE